MKLIFWVYFYFLLTTALAYKFNPNFYKDLKSFVETTYNIDKDGNNSDDQQPEDERERRRNLADFEQCKEEHTTIDLDPIIWEPESYVNVTCHKEHNKIHPFDNHINERLCYQSNRQSQKCKTIMGKLLAMKKVGECWQKQIIEVGVGCSCNSVFNFGLL